MTDTPAPFTLGTLARYQVTWLDQSGQVVGASERNTITSSRLSGWTLFEETITAPSEAASARVFVDLEGGSDDNPTLDPSIVLLDDLFFGLAD
jgi:hypothetical protein